jgi:hypothetical protein
MGDAQHVGRRRSRHGVERLDCRTSVSPRRSTFRWTAITSEKIASNIGIGHSCRSPTVALRLIALAALLFALNANAATLDGRVTHVVMATRSM